MIKYKVLEVGYALVGFREYPAELVVDYDIKGGPEKCLKIKSQTTGGRYGDGWWYFGLKDFTFIPNKTLNKLIGV